MEPDDIEFIADDEPDGSADPREKIQKLKQALTRSEIEKREYLDGWQRAKADIANSRRDEDKRFRDWRDRLENDMILEFLTAIDSFDLALASTHRAHLETETEKGFLLIRAQFADVLRRLDVEPVESVGLVFDPALHEAIEEVVGDLPAGTIVEELQKGYMRHGVLLRPARVKVSSGPTTQGVGNS